MECAKLGPVLTVKIFEHNPEGVVVVKFEEGRAAQKCVEVMNGRYFGGNKLEVFFYDGWTNYSVEESEESKQIRDKVWAAYLEGKEKQQKEDDKPQE